MLVIILNHKRRVDPAAQAVSGGGEQTVQERDFLLYRFNRFQACRYGLEGILTDVHTGEHKTVAEDIAWLLEQVAPSAEKLGATSAINEIALLLKQGKSEAQRMRDFIADGGSLISLVQKHCELWATSP